MIAHAAYLVVLLMASSGGVAWAVGSLQATRSAAEPIKVAQSNPKARPSTVKVGKARVPLSSQEMDKYCAQVVAPFDIDVSAVTLGKWTAGIVFDRFPNIFKGGSQGGSARHKISRETREEAARMNWLPMDVEKRYGLYLHRKAVENDDLLERSSVQGRRLYPVADALLADVLKGVSQAHPYKFEIHIRKESTDNAIALPGGIVYLDAGMLKDKASYPYASFALAHEIGHVLQRHETRIAQARIIDTLSLTASVGDLVETVRNPSSVNEQVIAAAAGGHKAFRRHYEGQELQADACSVRILDKIVTSDEALVLAIKSFLEKLPREESAQVNQTVSRKSGLEDLIETVNTPLDRHPSTKERTANLQSMLRTARREAPP